MVVGYHGTLQCSWRRCFLKTAPHYCRATSRLNAAAFDPEWTHGDTTLLPRTSASPLARFGQHNGAAMQRGLCSSHLLLSGCRWPRAFKYADEPRWPQWWSQSTGLTADYVVSRRCNDWRHASGPVGSPRTSVWICWTLLGYLLHSLVKVASRSTAGGKAAGQL